MTLLDGLLEKIEEPARRFGKTEVEVPLEEWLLSSREPHGDTMIPPDAIEIVYTYKWIWHFDKGSLTCQIQMNQSAIIDEKNQLTMYVAPHQVTWRYKGREILKSEGYGSYPVSFSPENGRRPQGLDRLFRAVSRQSAFAA